MGGELEERCEGPRSLDTASRLIKGELMARAYNVVDADGHILEPLDLWDRYMDPEFRRRPRLLRPELTLAFPSRA